MNKKQSANHTKIIQSSAITYLNYAIASADRLKIPTISQPENASKHCRAWESAIVGRKLYSN